MTDNEIIKALEHCLYKEHRQSKCTECKYVTGCKPYLMRESLDLINRQKAEIEKLQTTLFKKEDLMQMLFEQKQAYYDELVSAKAKIERLDKLTIEQHREIDRLYDYVQYTRAEAIKEFAERLKESAIDADVYSGYRKELFEKAVTVIEINRILEEMTEEI